jgi:hypothetical protein
MLIIFFVFYWISSIFIFLFKSGLYSKSTSVIQRFWKRTLYLFWSLELFLFFIYSWLVLISPSEVEWMFDQSQLFLSSYFNGLSFFNQILVTLVVLYIAVLLQYHITYTRSSIWLVMLLVLLFGVLLNDGSQTIITSLYYGNVSLGFSAGYQT